MLGWVQLLFIPFRYIVRLTALSALKQLTRSFHPAQTHPKEVNVDKPRTGNKKCRRRCSGRAESVRCVRRKHARTGSNTQTAQRPALVPLLGRRQLENVLSCLKKGLENTISCPSLILHNNCYGE
jgi:hypothetical protein